MKLPPSTKNARTFWEWHALGFRIRRGAKACWFTDNGDALFQPWDIYRPTYYRRRSYGHGDDTPDQDGGFWQDWADACGSEYGD